MDNSDDESISVLLVELLLSWLVCIVVWVAAVEDLATDSAVVAAVVAVADEATKTSGRDSAC